MVLARFLRLTPVYMFVLLFFWKVMPLIGSGPYWEDVAASSVAPCDDYWWTNLLYINNLYPFAQGVGAQCMPVGSKSLALRQLIFPRFSKNDAKKKP